jgi:hypothetical protein
MWRRAPPAAGAAAGPQWVQQTSVWLDGDNRHTDWVRDVAWAVGNASVFVFLYVLCLFFV